MAGSLDMNLHISCNSVTKRIKHFTLQFREDFDTISLYV
jgi:hypothetical protein